MSGKKFCHKEAWIVLHHYIRRLADPGRSKRILWRTFGDELDILANARSKHYYFSTYNERSDFHRTATHSRTKNCLGTLLVKKYACVAFVTFFASLNKFPTIVWLVEQSNRRFRRRRGNWAKWRRNSRNAACNRTRRRRRRRGFQQRRSHRPPSDWDYRGIEKEPSDRRSRGIL